jgi:hypothetical protein
MPKSSGTSRRSTSRLSLVSTSCAAASPAKISQSQESKLGTGPPPPGVHGVDDGRAVGLDEARLKLVGNAVVVQVAEVIGYYCAPLLSGHG